MFREHAVQQRSQLLPPPPTTAAAARATSNTATASSSLPRPDPPSTVKQPPDGDKAAVSKPAAATDADSTSKPLAPPPRPSQEGNGGENNSANGGNNNEYFNNNSSSSNNNKTSQYSLEPNLFEQSFGKTPDTPGKSILPPVASLTSPAPLTGNASLGGGYDWSGSLRSGPLSPAMLSGPTGPGDYFDSSLRGSFPTPNESSLRTGLTPGGGGSMFPAPSPNSQALFQSLASGGATPNTLDFHRTAMNAAAASKSETNGITRATTAATQAESMNATAPPPPPPAAAPASSNFAHHDNEAANGLYLLAQAGNESQANNQFAVPNQPANGDSNKRTRNAAAVGTQVQQAGADDASDADTKPNAKKAKKNSAAKGGNKSKKVEETPKSAKAKSVASTNSKDMDDDDDDEDDENDGFDKNGKKMTDEEKRKNFLERNRVAALKCRQRKKQWLANLQAKVEIFSSENDALNAQVNSLREEILNLKTILIAHKDCPIAQQQQIGQYVPQHQPDYNQNPYSMQMQPGQAVMTGPRRYS